MRYYFTLFTFILFISCASVSKEYLTNDSICHYNAPIFKITKEEMIFNVKKYQKELEKGDLVLVDNKNFKNRYYKFSDGEITNKQTNKQLGVGKWIRYRENGTIRWFFNLYLNGDSKIFKETQYDDKGNITKIINYEKGYNICWAEAIEIVKKIAKKDIKKYEVTGFNLTHNNLNEFTNAKPEWQISLDGNEEYEIKDTEIYRIDGVTGEFLRTSKIITTYD